MPRYFVEINFTLNSEIFDIQLEDIIELGAEKYIGESSFSEGGVGSFGGGIRSIGYTFPSRRHAKDFAAGIKDLLESFNMRNIKVVVGRDTE